MTIPDTSSLGQALEIIRDLIDPSECRYDHHGYCQAHADGSEKECVQARAKRFLEQEKIDAIQTSFVPQLPDVRAAPGPTPTTGVRHVRHHQLSLCQVGSD